MEHETAIEGSASEPADDATVAEQSTNVQKTTNETSESATTPGQRKRRVPAWIGQKAPQNLADAATALPQLQYPGQIMYIASEPLANAVCNKMILRAQTSPITVGFDVEWWVTFQAGNVRKVSLIQIATEERCYLIHIGRMWRPGEPPHIPQGLRELLADEAVQKAGVGITGDGWKLLRDFEAEVKGIIDLNEMATQRIPTQGKWSLARLLNQVDGTQISKESSLRCSNWELKLSPQQRLYATLDAWAGLLLFNKLSAMALLQLPAPMSHSEAPQALRTCSATRTLDPPHSSEGGTKRRKIGPSKLLVYELIRDGRSLDEVCAMQRLQFSTVAGYLYDCCAEGHNWELSWLRIPPEDLQTVLGALEALTDPSSGMTAATGGAGQQPKTTPTSVEQEGDTMPERLAAAAEAMPAAVAMPTVAMSSVRQYFVLGTEAGAARTLGAPQFSASKNTSNSAIKAAPTDTTSQPMRLKDVKERCPEHISYNTIRFALLAFHQGQFSAKGINFVEGHQEQHILDDAPQCGDDISVPEKELDKDTVSQPERATHKPCVARKRHPLASGNLSAQ